MSGKPYPEGVAKVLDALAQMDALAGRIEDLAPLVAKLSAELQSARDKRSELSNAVGILLRSMDLESPGNYGFEGRIGWFIGEMRRQFIAARVASTPDRSRPVLDPDKMNGAADQQAFEPHPDASLGDCQSPPAASLREGK